MLFIRPYLEVTDFTIRTDEDLLILIMNLYTATVSLHLWLLFLMGYDFEVQNRFGSIYQAPDAPSHLKTTKSDSSPLEDIIPVFLLPKGT